MNTFYMSFESIWRKSGHGSKLTMYSRRALALGCTLLSITTAIFFLSTNQYLLKKSDQRHVDIHPEEMFYWSIKYKQDRDRNSPATDYCNFPSEADADMAEEGKPPNSSWILKQVQIVIRHGDRSPIGGNGLYHSQGIQPKYCQIRPNQQPSHPTLKNFMETMALDSFKMKMKGHKLLQISPFPNQPVCKSASLSQLGVVQHLRNGELLQERYVRKHGLLSQVTGSRKTLAPKVYVISTITPRTIQSAIAFLYGLIPAFHLNQVDINYSQSDLFNFKRCDMPNVNKNVSRARYNVYLKRQKQHPIFQNISKSFNVGDHSGPLIDGFVTGFLCKNMKLPCNGASCVSVKDLDVLLQEEEFLQQYIAEKSAYVNQSMMNMQPLLEGLSKFMSTIISNKPGPEIVLVSGHDTTLKPLIRTLGIPEHRWPRLGSRLVFELWFDPGGKEHYVRILLNGKEYTKETMACKNHDSPMAFCLARELQSFINYGIFEHFGAKSYAQACLRNH